MADNQNERLGFFRRVFLAITDFRLYPFVQREKTKVATSYFTLLLVVFTIFLSLSYSSMFFDTVAKVLNGYDENMPDFIFKDGILDVEDKIYNIDDENKFVVDTDMGYEDFSETEVGKEVLYSNSFVIINSDGIVYGTKDSTIVYLFQTFRVEITKEGLRDYLMMINDNLTVKMAIIAVTWLVLFISYYIIKMINVLFLIAMAWILNLLFGMKLKFANYYRVVVYAITLPLIVELISLLWLGRLPEYAVVAYQLLTYVYIFYALRALKLDILIISTPGNGLKEKIENMIQKLENEMEEKAKKEDDEDNDKKV